VINGAEGARTPDLLAASQTLSQLSYGPLLPSKSSGVREGAYAGLHSGQDAQRTNEPLTSLEQARRIAGLAEEKLAQDIVILDMRPVCAYTDYFVVCSGQNSRQTRAIVDEVRHGLKHGEERVLPHAVDGEREGDWIVADFLDVVLPVFTPETRDYYGLEELWDDVPSVEHATAS
jgi:ribosome-associated protein